jgi:hypothetical protein
MRNFEGGGVEYNCYFWFCRCMNETAYARNDAQRNYWDMTKKLFITPNQKKVGVYAMHRESASVTKFFPLLAIWTDNAWRWVVSREVVGDHTSLVRFGNSGTRNQRHLPAAEKFPAKVANFESQFNSISHIKSASIEWEVCFRVVNMLLMLSWTLQTWETRRINIELFGYMLKGILHSR